jgi:ferredoxin
MKITVDATLCSGHGRCYTLVPELFDTDDEGFCAQRGQVIEVPAGLESRGQLGIDCCPEGAITAVADDRVSP